MRRLTVTGIMFLVVFVTAFSGTVYKADAALYDSGLINLAIPDGDENGIWAGISVSDSFVISDVSVTLDIEHGWIGDLGIALVDPSGDFIWLIDDPTCMNANELAAGNRYTFTDNAAGFLPVGTHLDYITIPGSSYRPDDAKEDPITIFASSFAGDNSQGDWQLYLVDVSPADDGTLISWELDLTPVPIPGAIWLLGSGLAGLVGLRRKFRN